MSPRRPHARRKSGAARTTWLAVGAAVLGGAGLATVAVAAPDGAASAEEAARPAGAQTMAFGGTAKAKRTLPRTETKVFSLIGVSWEDHTKRFDGTAQIRTRSAETGEWSGWRDLDFDTVAPETDETRAADTRGASEPLWAGPSDAVEARVVADGTQTAVPQGLRLDLIDPGTAPKTKGKSSNSGTQPSTLTSTDSTPSATSEPSEPAATEPSVPAATGDATASDPAGSGSGAEDTASPTPSDSAPDASPTTGDSSTPVPSTPAETSGGTTDPAPTPTGTQEPDPTPPADSATPTEPAAPAVVSRAAWGADESLVKDPPEYLSKVEAVFVHHTAGTNDYNCADSPAVIRAILVYHVQTNGWNDVGYNFFVDKCGTVFEGRAGGIDQRVRGAHTYGFNGVSSGIALLGDYENGGTPTAAAQQAIADLAAWKLGLDGVDPQAQVTLTAAGDTGVYKTGEKATLYTISGHRDGYATLCPGQTLYDALPDIRTQAAASRYAAGL
ncbi:N-acetylmuramoyl-L-alanine amidase [Streptomyces sp. NPDC002577]